MSLTINTNISALSIQRALSNTQSSMQTSMQRLSTGLRINSAKDDAAGLAISDGMTSQIRGMTVAVRNANDGISMTQTADSGMSSITENLQRMRDLAVQSANTGTVSATDRDKLQTEFSQLGSEITRVITNTKFNGNVVLNGGMNGINFQVGAGTTADNQIGVSIADLATVSGITDIVAGTMTIGGSATPANILSAIDNIDAAIKNIDDSRATLGAVQNRFTSTIANLQSSIENQTAARSRILDADFASETSNLSHSQILQQAGMSMLSQANQSNQSVLSLLR